MTNKINLKGKIQFSLLFIGVVSIGLISWITFTTVKDTLETLTFERLTSVRENKKRQIENYYENIDKQIKTLSEENIIVTACQENAIRKTSGYQFDNYIKKFCKRFNIEEIYLYKVNSNKVVYSSSLDSDKMVVDNNNNLISEISIKSLKLNSNVLHSDFYFPTNPKNKYYFLSAAPIYSGKSIVGVLVFKILNNTINEIMTNNNNWKEAGFGNTGETYIVGEDYRLRNDSRFIIQEPEKYFATLNNYNTEKNTIELMKKYSSTVLLQKAKTEAVKDALDGNTDTKIVMDYRHIEVLSSYTKLKIDNLNWVLIAEIDTREAFNTIYSLKEKLIMISLLVLIFSAIIGVIISRIVIYPLNKVRYVVEKFSKGDLMYRDKDLIKNEFGLLVSTLYNMAEKILLNTKQLEDEITERKKMEEELLISEEKLRNLSMHLQSVREEERKVIAREIHDELGQALNTIKLRLAIIKDEFEIGDKRSNSLNEIILYINSTIQSVKKLISQLRPQLIDDLGLVAAIEWHTREFQKDAKIACNLSINPQSIVIQPEKAISIFRIFQETLTNIARHSEATQVEISLCQKAEHIELVVIDNGKGILKEEIDNSKSFGIIGMHERVNYWKGELKIENNVDVGTKIFVKIPN